MNALGLGLLLGCLSACGNGGDPPAPRAADPAPTATAPAKTAEDPLLVSVCRAHDEVAAEGVEPGVLLQSTALRAMERHGVTEARMNELGASPAALLASIRSRGAPAACTKLVIALEARR